MVTFPLAALLVLHMDHLPGIVVAFQQACTGYGVAIVTILLLLLLFLLSHAVGLPEETSSTTQSALVTFGELCRFPSVAETTERKVIQFARVPFAQKSAQRPAAWIGHNRN